MKRLVLGPLQKALNAYLALDPESKQRLLKLQGKTVTLELLGTGVMFHLVFTEKEILVQTGELLTADTVIKGTPLRLVHMALSRDNRKKFFEDDVSIEGNAELGQEVIELFDHLEIDWEEQLSHWIGDTPAFHLGRLGRKLKAWSQKTREILLQDVNEYVHEEVNFFPPREALQDFFQDIDVLRLDVDRLEARVHLLQKMLKDKRGET